MIIPGELIALVTFPGVIMHEIAHRFVCDLLHIPVYKIHYFSIETSRSGHVLHDKTDSVKHSFLIGIAPLLINSLLCMIFTLPYSSTIMITRAGIGDFPIMFLWWVGISMGAHAFPSNQDMDNVLAIIEEPGDYPFVWSFCKLIKFFNKLRFFWITFFYAYGISFILPYFIFRF